MPVAAQSTAIDCGEIILPVTPPLGFAATSSVSETLICCAVVDCSEPNRALEEVSEPVRNTPSQPRNGEKNGPDDINDNPALLTYETNFTVNTYTCNSVRMTIPLAKIRLCFTV